MNFMIFAQFQSDRPMKRIFPSSRRAPHRGQRVVEVLIVRTEIAVMKVVEIDDVGPHVSQRTLALRAHEVRIVEMIRRAFDPAEFRRQENLFARNLAKDLADELLGVPVAISIRGIPVRDAVAIRGGQRFLREAIVVTAPSDGNTFADVRPAVSPCAEGDSRNKDVGAAEAYGAHRSRFQFSVYPECQRGISGGAATTIHEQRHRCATGHACGDKL